jgi:CrcB protein
MNAVLAVAIGAAIGAPLRYVVDNLVTKAAARGRFRPFPWGLLAVNTAGSAFAGLVVARGWSSPLLLIGLAGSFTTFSGLSWQLDALRRSHRPVFWAALALIPGASMLAFWLAWSAA